jgi:carbon monoxide dehydrogenase subunit G
MIQISSEFTVGAPPIEVYEVLLDLERVGPCIPGAIVGPPDSEGKHPAELAVRLGPMRLNYKGGLSILQRDDEQRRATLSADVRETHGQGTARAQMTMQVNAQGPGSHVAATTDVELTGRAAQMGRGVVEDVATRLVNDMGERLETMLMSHRENQERSPGAADPEPAAPAAPINGLSLLIRALWAGVRRWLARLRRSP